MPLPSLSFGKSASRTAPDLELVRTDAELSVRATPAPAPQAAAPAPEAQADFKAAAAIGAELSTSVAIMQRIVQEFHETRKVSRIQMARLESAIEASGKVARQSQQLARLAEGRLRQSHERLRLDEMVDAVLDDRNPYLLQRGGHLQRAIRPVEIIVDPGLLSSLVESMVDWALRFGHHLNVALFIKNWPENGCFRIQVTSGEALDGFPDDSTNADTLEWFLLVQIAKTMGVALSRELGLHVCTIEAEFARTVKQLEGLTAVDLGSGEESSLHTQSKPLAGHRILLLTTDASIRGEVQKACRLLGLVVDAVATTDQAVRYVELDMPHMLIVDERLRDPTLDELLADLKRLNPNFGFLEIADSANTFEISSWMSDSITRISRDALRTQLPSVLTLELAKVL